MKSYKYNVSLTEYKRFATREVNVGNLPLGGKNPIRIQSMTTTDTMNTESTAAEVIRMINAGAEYVRITAPSVKDAENLRAIKSELSKRGVYVPLIADIHFTPNAAEVAAQIVEKVRVNPGNYIDKKIGDKSEYTDEEYQYEIDKIEEKFSPLVEICKANGTAMRIGTNHGSLSERIVLRYGDTPEGMVESAAEFINVCRKLNFNDLVLSMKSSNTGVMVAAYRLLMKRMIEEGWDYPLHLGVTEAGDGMEGRIKSAVGIGALLEDGIGDTIRVSLTEPPENELPVAAIIAERYSNRKSDEGIPPIDFEVKNPFVYSKRETTTVMRFGGKNSPAVIADLSDKDEITELELAAIGYGYNNILSKYNKSDIAADAVFIGKADVKCKIPRGLIVISERKIPGVNVIPFVRFSELEEKVLSGTTVVELSTDDIYSDKFNEVAGDKQIIFKIISHRENFVLDVRRAFFELDKLKVKNPVILSHDYSHLQKEKFLIYSSIDFGAVFLEGYGDGVWARAANKEITYKYINEVMFGILQAARVRISKTEYISCPSCGRTLFDLVEVTGKIREKTSHLKGVKIGIMGCIVNGPGEMADADYGYVGSGHGKITLYKGQKVVMRNIPADTAVEELIKLIKENGDWVEPKG